MIVVPGPTRQPRAASEPSASSAAKAPARRPRATTLLSAVIADHQWRR